MEIKFESGICSVCDKHKKDIIVTHNGGFLQRPICCKKCFKEIQKKMNESN